METNEMIEYLEQNKNRVGSLTFPLDIGRLSNISIEDVRRYCDLKGLDIEIENCGGWLKIRYSIKVSGTASKLKSFVEYIQSIGIKS